MRIGSSRITTVVLFLAGVFIAVPPLFAGGAQHPCAVEVKQFCADVQPGKGRIAQCLARNGASLSSACREHLASARKGRQAFREACGDDFFRFCWDEKPGKDRIAACLRRHETELTADCKAKVAGAKRPWK
ncbi:MAG: cysteine rich repeat-containing protein [Nitrospiraceae bacterium]|nr:cysteine rich repeat-containing protein [Nitrospiraceae bacterium]